MKIEEGRGNKTDDKGIEFRIAITFTARHRFRSGTYVEGCTGQIIVHLDWGETCRDRE